MFLGRSGPWTTVPLTNVSTPEKAASGTSGACGHFVEIPAILSKKSRIFDRRWRQKSWRWNIKDRSRRTTKLKQ